MSAGAHEFASATNILAVPPDTMISNRAHKEWKMWSDMARTGVINDTSHPDMKSGNHIMQDTVGSVVLDASGGLAAGVSRYCNFATFRQSDSMIHSFQRRSSS